MRNEEHNGVGAESGSRMSSRQAEAEEERQREEDRRREMETKTRLEEIYRSEQRQQTEARTLVDDSAGVVDENGRWERDRADRLSFQARLLAELERHNQALESILDRLSGR